MLAKRLPGKLSKLEYRVYGENNHIAYIYEKELIYTPNLLWVGYFYEQVKQTISFVNIISTFAFHLIVIEIDSLQDNFYAD